MTTITGNTYPVKEQLKALGGKWNKQAQGWDVPDDKAEEARRLVAAAPASSPPPATGRGGRFRSGRRRRFHSGGVSNVTTFSSGATVFTNRQGRCEDAPCCGCCS